jgi:cell division protein FtsZ
MEGLIKSVIGERDSSNLDDVSGTEQIKIVTVGVGGAGNNTINRLIRAGIKGCNLLAVNTDKQHLNMIDEKAKKVLIGKTLTKGLGAGGYPEIGTKAAEIDRPLLEKELSGAHLVFLCAGMGGGTGTGAAPVIAEIAKEQGAITVAMVTYPFNLERARRVKADEGIMKLRKVTDSVIILDNNRLVKIVPNLPMNEAFSVADEILAKAIGGLVWTITQPSLINIDFADVRSIMGGGGVSMIAVGEAKGTDRVTEVVKNTLHHRLLDVDYRGATGVLLHLTGGGDMTLGEANQIGELLTEEVEPTANVIWGARLDGSYEGRIEAIAIFTGIKSPYVVGKPRRGADWSLGEV